VKGGPKVREERGPPGLRPGGWPRHGGVRGDEGLGPIGMRVEPVLKGGG